MICHFPKICLDLTDSGSIKKNVYNTELYPFKLTFLRSRPLMNHNPGKFGLRATLVVPFVLQIFVAVGLVGYLSFRNGQKAVNNVASQLRREVAARVQVHLTSYLAKPHLIEQIHINTIRQKLLDSTNFQQMEGYFWQQSQSLSSNIGTIAFANSKGEFVGANKPEGYTVIANETTGKAIRRYAVDNQGNRIKLIKEKPNYDARTRDWYKAAVQRRHPNLECDRYFRFR